MKSIGIIAEFNPFHQGHRYLAERAREETGCDTAVAVMSGSFVQRGAPAAFDKWTRAEMAVREGISLVAELPAVYACSSAEIFAKGGVSILDGFGCIDFLAFGSESGSLDQLESAASFLSAHRSELNGRIRALMKEGFSHPRARQAAAEALDAGFDMSVIQEPNNILALEYLQQLENLQQADRHRQHMRPWTVRRQGEGHHSSATRLRASLRQEDPQLWDERDRLYWQLVTAAALRASPEELREVFSAGGGLSEKLKKEIRYADSAESLAERLKSKAYTHTRISRLLVQTLLGIDQRAVSEAVPYIRILAFDERGARLLKEIRKRGCAEIPVITNINREMDRYPQVRSTLEKDILAADMLNLIHGRDLYRWSDFVQMPRFVKTGK
ncbi:MAG: nucleotidyltransferase family protein [Emergencia sp.]